MKKYLNQPKTCSGLHIFKIISQISHFLVLSLQKSSIKLLSNDSQIDNIYKASSFFMSIFLHFMK